MERRQDLRASVDELTDEVQELRRVLKKRTLALCAVIVIVMAAALTVSLDNRSAIERNNQRWCPVVEPLAPHPGDPPPQGTPEEIARALRIRKAFTDLVRDFGCTRPK